MTGLEVILADRSFFIGCSGFFMRKDILRDFRTTGTGQDRTAKMQSVSKKDFFCIF